MREREREREGGREGGREFHMHRTNTGQELNAQTFRGAILLRTAQEPGAEADPRLRQDLRDLLVSVALQVRVAAGGSGSDEEHPKSRKD